MKILTAQQMAQLDSLSIKKHGISPQALMDRAAQACVHELLKTDAGNILIVCGPGNNGGDGLAMAYFLRQKKKQVQVFFTGKQDNLSKEAKYFLEKLSPQPLPLKNRTNLKSLKSALKKSDWVVDALFGTGLNRQLRGHYGEILKVLNRATVRRLAVDIPSGISGDSGEVLGIAFQAHVTVTFEVPKWGQLQPPAWDYVGHLVVAPIGLHRGELKKMKGCGEFIDTQLIRKNFSPRSRRTHKGRNGRVLILAGSRNMPGAGYLSALAALRTGAGLVTWALPEEAFHHLELKHPEILFLPLPSQAGKFSSQAMKILKKRAADFDAMVLGPGWGRGGGLAAFLEGVLKVSIPKIIDADALNLLSENPKLLRKCAKQILTPHPKEMGRLNGKALGEILAHREKTATQFAKKYGLYLVLKSFRSACGNPKGELFINGSGGPNLAVAGSGDVLSGCIAALRAGGLSAQAAMLTGVYLHGKAGDELAQVLGDRGALASEVAGQIPKTIKGLLSQELVV